MVGDVRSGASEAPPGAFPIHHLVTPRCDAGGMPGTTTGGIGGRPPQAERPRLVLLPGGLDPGRAGAVGTGPAGGEGPSEGGAVVAEVASVLAQATGEVGTAAPLALPLALSVCMERHAVGTSGLIDAMQALRAALLSVSGMDARAEPVPLVAGDARAAALGMAEYLRGLIARAAHASAAAPDVVASAAAARLA